MCSVLGVARSTYYQALNKTESIRAKENEELKQAIQRIYEENKGCYGSPKIYYILGQQGYRVSEKRVQRLMRELGLF